MESVRHLHILDSGSIKLIEYGDQLNRKLGGFIKALSRFIAGIIVIILLLPVSVVVVILTTIVSRFALEYLNFTLNKAYNHIPASEERELMEALVDVDHLFSLLTREKVGLSDTSTRKLYFSIFFGSSWNKCIGLTSKIKLEIENKVYPNLNSEPSDKQIAHLIEEYKGLETG